MLSVCSCAPAKHPNKTYSFPNFLHKTNLLWVTQTDTQTLAQVFCKYNIYSKYVHLYFCPDRGGYVVSIGCVK